MLRRNRRTPAVEPVPQAVDEGATTAAVPDRLIPLRELVDGVSGRRILVLHDEALAEVAGLLGDRVIAVPVGGALPDPSLRVAMVLLLVRDRGALRRAAPLLPQLRSTRVAAWWLERADRPVQPMLRPEWPDVEEVASRLTDDGGCLGWLAFAGRGPGVRVLRQVAHDAVPAPVQAGPVVAATPSGRAGVLPDDAATVLVDEPADASDEERDVPPDLVLHGGDARLPDHHVLGRPPAVVRPPALPPLDEGVLNPTGFLRASSDELPVLLGEGTGLRIDGLPDLVLDERGPTESQVSRLRSVRGLALDWTGADPAAMAHVVAGYAMAGVPLVGTPAGPARALLGDELSDLLGSPVDLDDELRREEHSVRLRRAALLVHSSRAARARLAGAAGLRWSGRPTVSAVLSSRRADRLDFAMRQLAKQRLDAELVLAAHGFRPDRAAIAEVLGDRPVTVVERPADESFGDVLDAAVRASSGEVVTKMDDDDWYGPDFLGDLLLARQYSGADVVGTSTEFVYLEPMATTIRRGDNTELAVRVVVSGASLTLSRQLLSELGGFRPVRRYVDASLLAAVHAGGGTVYRSHGLNFCYRRTADGHTWDPGLDYFLDEERISDRWDGFRPSLLLEHGPEELPAGPPAR